MPRTWTDTPLTRCSAAAFPLLIKAHDSLHGVAAPQASRLADKIADLMDAAIQLAGEVEAYGNKWDGGTMGDLAVALRDATSEFNRI